MKNYLRSTLSRLGGTWRTAWGWRAGVPLRAGRRRACLAVASARRRILLALIAVLNVIAVGQVAAQTFTILHSFSQTSTNSFGAYTNSDGAVPIAGLLLSGNTLYGTASEGGRSGYGTVFAINTDGTGLTNLHSFAGSDGDLPLAGLILSGSTLYGTARAGGVGAGTVFAVNIDGRGFTNLHSFTGSDGAVPIAGLLLSGDTLYGTTSEGGSWGDFGTVFAVNTDGSGFTNLHSFTAILSGNTVYGTAQNGGSSGKGTVFKVKTNSTGFTTLYSFTATAGPYPSTNNDGGGPRAGLILSGNTLYGTAEGGGSSGAGTVFAVNTDGTGFTNLHSFSGTSNNSNSDGIGPEAGLLLSGNTLYGTAVNGGSSGAGTVFAVNIDGTGFTNLHSFTGSDGANPLGLLLSGSTLYGTAYSSGSSGNGTIFSISFRPQLTITPSGVPPSGVILSWPTNVAGFDYTGYTLQSTTNLLSPAAWVTNSPAPVVVNGQNTVTNPITGAQRFYRLVE